MSPDERRDEILAKHRRDPEPKPLTEEWPTCACCGSALPDDRSFCEPCEDAECGEQDYGVDKCLAEEADRVAKLEAKAALYDEALSSLRNAVARLDELTAERDRVGAPYFAGDAAAPGFMALREAYVTAADAVRSEAFCVVGAVEAVLRRGGKR